MLVTLVLFRCIVEFHLDLNTPPGLLLEELLVVGTERMNVFTVQLPPGITRANMEFMGTPGDYTFDFDTSQCSGSFVGWGDYDFDYESEKFQMEREFDRRNLQRPHMTNYLYKRMMDRFDTYNPARPRNIPGLPPHPRSSRSRSRTPCRQSRDSASYTPRSPSYSPNFRSPSRSPSRVRTCPFKNNSPTIG